MARSGRFTLSAAVLVSIAGCFSLAAVLVTRQDEEVAAAVFAMILASAVLSWRGTLAVSAALTGAVALILVVFPGPSLAGITSVLPIRRGSSGRGAPTWRP